MSRLLLRVSREAWVTHPNVHEYRAKRVSVWLRLRQFRVLGVLRRRSGGLGRRGLRVGGQGSRGRERRRAGPPRPLCLVKADDMLPLVEADDLGVPAPAKERAEERAG